MKRQSVLVWLLILALAASVGVAFAGYSYDDNFITYRYAHNWQRGEGLVYNIGERVFGTSAPGYAVLLGSLGFVGAPVGFDIPYWATWISLAAIVLTASVLYGFLLSNRAVAFGSAAIATTVFAALALTSRLDIYLLGTETLPVMALTTMAAYLLFVDEPARSDATRRDAVAGVLVGVAMCLRLDAALAAGVLGVTAWIRRRRLPRAYALVGLAILTACASALHLYYGSLVPNTLGGKRALVELSYTLRQWQTLTQALPPASAVVLIVGAVAGVGVLARLGLWRHPLVLALAGWVLLHEVTYRALGVWFAPWYHMALWHALLALYALAATAGGTAVASRLPRGTRAVAAGVLTLLLASPILVPSLRSTLGHWGEPPDYRYDIYRRTADALQLPPDELAGCKLSPDTSALVFEIGVVGYFSDCRILDLGGLVSPRFTEAKFTFDRPALAAALQPDFIVAIDDPLIAQTLDQPDIRHRYSLMVQLEDSVFRSPVRILRRQRDGEPHTADGDSVHP